MVIFAMVISFLFSGYLCYYWMGTGELYMPSGPWLNWKWLYLLWKCCFCFQATCVTAGPGQVNCTCPLDLGYTGNGYICYGNIVKQIEDHPNLTQIAEMLKVIFPLLHKLFGLHRAKKCLKHIMKTHLYNIDPLNPTFI